MTSQLIKSNCRSIIQFRENFRATCKQTHTFTRTHTHTQRETYPTNWFIGDLILFRAFQSTAPFVEPLPSRRCGFYQSLFMEVQVLGERGVCVCLCWPTTRGCEAVCQRNFLGSRCQKVTRYGEKARQRQRGRNVIRWVMYRFMQECMSTFCV